MSNAQKIEVKRKVFCFTIDEKDYEVKPPTLRQVRELNQRIKAKKEDEDEIDFSVSFLDELGLPKEVGMDLQPEMLQFIVETVTGEKKS